MSPKWMFGTALFVSLLLILVGIVSFFTRDKDQGFVLAGLIVLAITGICYASSPSRPKHCDSCKYSDKPAEAKEKKG